MLFVFATRAQCAGVVPKLIFACNVNVTSLLIAGRRNPVAGDVMSDMSLQSDMSAPASDTS